MTFRLDNSHDFDFTSPYTSFAIYDNVCGNAGNLAWRARIILCIAKKVSRYIIIQA